jgi:lysophospholipase L1-like esterase
LKIVIIGDSTAIPRLKNTEKLSKEVILEDLEIENPIENTYPYILNKKIVEENKKFVYMENFSYHGANSFNIINKLYLAKCFLFNPDIIVLNIGLVDCWERDEKQDKHTPYEFMKGKNPWVSKMEFFKNITEFIKYSNSNIEQLKKIIIVAIPYTSEKQYLKYRSSLENTIKYNEILREVSKLDKCVFVDSFEKLKEIKEEITIEDGIHLNYKGAEIVAENIFEEISKI